MILHGDLDAFYAAIAQRDEPSLRGRPLVVAGSSRRAVVLTASYEARRYGIHSAMPLFDARQRCRDLVVVPPTFDRYRIASEQLFQILRARSQGVEGMSLDEAFCDLGDVSLEDAVAKATAIKAAVHEATQLALSVGIASGKMVAKIASDDGKPDGLVAVPAGTEAAYLESKPVRRLWGIGPKTERRLQAEGLHTIGDIARLDDARLHDLFGRWGSELRDLARGIDRRPVSEGGEARSISSEQTFEHDVSGVEALLPHVREQAADVAERLQRHGLRASTIGVKIKFSDFQIRGRQTSLAQPTDDPRIIAAAAAFCLRRTALRKPVRLIGVRASAIVPAGARQIGLFYSSPS